MLDCTVIKEFPAWHEIKHKYIQARMLKCEHKYRIFNVIDPEGTTYTFDSENRIVWVVKDAKD